MMSHESSNENAARNIDQVSQGDDQSVGGLGQGSGRSAEEITADFIVKGILRVSPVGSVWRYKKKVGGNQGPRLKNIHRVRAEKELPNGYLQIQVYLDGERITCASHRLIWFLYNGEIPNEHNIHHRNEDRQDNRIGNLECLPVGDHVRLHAKDRKVWNKGKGGTEQVKRWHRKTIETRAKNYAEKCAETYKLWESGLSKAEVARAIGFTNEGVRHRLRHHEQYSHNEGER